MATIKMDRRLAERLINEGATHVVYKGKEVWTKGTIKYVDTHELVYIQELGIHVELMDILRIEYTNRFGDTFWMEVDWNE